jgi:hypothetical protein
LRAEYRRSTITIPGFGGYWGSSGPRARKVGLSSAASNDSPFLILILKTEKIKIQKALGCFFIFEALGQPYGKQVESFLNRILFDHVI